MRRRHDTRLSSRPSAARAGIQVSLRCPLQGAGVLGSRVSPLARLARDDGRVGCDAVGSNGSGMTKLYRLAHCRAGHKGNTTVLSLIAYRQEDFALLRERVTVEAVKRHLGHLITAELVRYELPNLWALQFVGHDALAGGVTTSLALDAHGKSLSSALLEMEIDTP